MRALNADAELLATHRRADRLLMQTRASRRLHANNDAATASSGKLAVCVGIRSTSVVDVDVAAAVRMVFKTHSDEEPDLRTRDPDRHRKRDPSTRRACRWLDRAEVTPTPVDALSAQPVSRRLVEEDDPALTTRATRFYRGSRLANYNE